MSTMMEEILNYNKARHAKEAIVWRLYVAYVQAYDYTPKMLHRVVENNKGTQLFTKNIDRLFWAFTQTVQALEHYRLPF